MKNLNTTILQKRDTAQNWATNNPILADGVLAFDTTSRKAKLGDGVSRWNTLPYLNDDKVDKVDGKGLSTNDYDNTSKDKVDNIPANPKYTDTVTAVVNNLTTTSTTSALSANQGKILNDNKVDKVVGKGLSTNDYDNTSKGKVDNIPANPKYTDTVTAVVNNLTTTSTTSALSANQGKILNDNKMDKSGGTFTGQVKAQSNADYSVGQVRNIASGTTLPSTSGFGNGDIFIVRSS